MSKWKQSVLCMASGVVLTASATVSFAGHSGGCSNATLRGVYGYSQQGTIIGLAPVPLAAGAVGLITADGDGNLSGNETLNIAGQQSSNSFGNGRYEVNGDCSGTATWNAVFADGRPPEPRSASFVINRRSKEIHIVSTSPGSNAVFVGVARP